MKGWCNVEYQEVSYNEFFQAIDRARSCGVEPSENGGFVMVYVLPNSAKNNPRFCEQYILPGFEELIYDNNK